MFLKTIEEKGKINFKSDFIDYSYLAGMKRLFMDFLGGESPAINYYKWNFRSVNDYFELADRLSSIEFPRQRLAEILWEDNCKIECASKIRDNIDKFSDPDSLVVIAGQQVGIFGGPLLTFYKAVGVVKLAAQLSKRLSKPVVPIFWMATEDHDYEEANSIYLVNSKGERIKIYNEPGDNQLGKSMSQIKLGEGIKKAISELQNNLLHTEYTDSLFGRISKYYKPGNKISEAFAGWVSELLRDYGLILLDPSNAEFKELAVPIYEKEIRGGYDTEVPNDKRQGDGLIADGYHLQVQKFKKGLNLFYADKYRERILLAAEEKGFILDRSQKKIDEARLVQLLYDTPEKFSSGVLLRPIVQSKLLPTVCFIGGASEIAYHSQLPPYYEYFNVIPPIIRPRPSVSLMGKRIRSIVDKYGMDIRLLFNDPHRVVNEVLIKYFPAGLEGKLNHLQMEVLDLLASISPELRNYDDGLRRTFASSVRKVETELNKLRAKIFQAHKKKNAEITGQILRAYDSFFPNGVMQERVLPMIYFLNKYSPSFADRLAEEIDIDRFQHQIISILPE